MDKKAQKSKKQKRSKAGTGSYLRYRDENRRLRNKVSRLARRWKNYKKQPPRALKGLTDNALRALVLKRLGFEHN